MKSTKEIMENKNMEINPYFHGVIFSRIIETEDNLHFIIPISFGNKTKFNIKEISKLEIKKFAEKLNEIYKITRNKWITNEELNSFKPFRLKNNCKIPNIFCIINNENNLPKNEFLKLIYFNLLNKKYIQEEVLNENKKNFIRGFFESRGSLDFKAKFYSIDYFWENKYSYDIKRVLIFVNYLSIPLECLNINFRNLQPDYLKDKRRNTQVRINLDWYISKIGLSFPYRIDAIKNQYKFCKYFVKKHITYFKISQKDPKKFSDDFIYKINFYIKNVLLQEALDESKINQIRIDLNLDKDKINRNQTEKMRVYLEKSDICFGCNDLYEIEKRTFKRKSDNRFYLEIHHNIPYSNNKQELDMYDNMVKLCPVCHAALKKNRTSEMLQKEIIKNIISYDKDCKLFALTYFNIAQNNIDNLIDVICSHLK